jgi:ribose 5-phosphate isomerase A
VEVLEFGWRSQARYLETLGATVVRREGDSGPYRTDEGNMILDCRFGPIADPAGLAGKLQSRAGIVGHGLFIGIASDMIVAGEAGFRHLRRGVEEATVA